MRRRAPYLRKASGRSARSPPAGSPKIRAPLDAPEQRSKQRRAGQPLRRDRDTPVSDDLLLHTDDPGGVAFEDIRVRQKSQHVGVVKKRFALLLPGMVLQFDQSFNKRIGKALFQRITHRHIHLSDLRRQSMQQGQQQVSSVSTTAVSFPSGPCSAASSRRIEATYLHCTAFDTVEIASIRFGDRK